MASSVHAFIGSMANGLVAGVLVPLVMHSTAALALASAALMAVGLVYWFARLWIKTSRGEMHDDPIIYAFSDVGSRVVVLLMLVIMLVARFCTLEVPR